MSKEAMMLALEALKQIDEAMPFPVAKLAQAALREALAERPAQQEPVAYDKTELNCFAQDLYDQKMREGKHGHYESMFHVIHQCVKKVASPPAQRTWVGLTDEEQTQVAWSCGAMSADWLDFARAIEAKLKEKNT